MNKALGLRLLKFNPTPLALMEIGATLGKCLRDANVNLTWNHPIAKWKTAETGHRKINLKQNLKACFCRRVLKLSPNHILTISRSHIHTCMYAFAQ